MDQKTFTSIILFSLCLGLFTTSSFANCPGCVIDLPAGMAEDTIFISSLPSGTAGVYYDNDASFRMPKTTTPVNAVDPDVPVGLNISQINIISLSNLPPGLSWEADQTNYDPSVNTDGCFKFCGTPLQPGLYIIEVTVEATVIIITQTATFYMELLIEPATSVTEGFSMINPSGCGEVTVSFENNIPSNGNPGFSYFWDFGNGVTSLDENPQDQTYSQPGMYVVDYNATIDTVGYVLTKVVVAYVTCDDIPTAPDWSFKPDLHIEIRNPSGVLIYSSATVWNTDTPVDYFPNITLADGNYELKVIDTDSGINGADDICGLVTFNKLSNGIISGGDFIGLLEIIHPVETVHSTDTVWVYENPEAPEIIAESATDFCEGGFVVLNSSYAEGNQWLKDGVELPGENEAYLEVLESGDYSVVHTNEFGCFAASEEILIEVFELPVTPEYSNQNNLLSLLGNIDYPGGFTFQWYQNAEPLVGETQDFYCAQEDGEYTLEVTDPESGCTNFFTETIVFNPEVECFVSAEDLADNFIFSIFPNPADDLLNVSFEQNNPEDFTISIYDLLGRRHYFRSFYETANPQLTIAINLDGLTSGMYIVEILSGEKRASQKFVLK